MRWALFWLLLCFAATALAEPYLQRHPENPDYVRIINPDSISWWCWAYTVRGYKERYIKPYGSTLWLTGIIEWGCEPA